MGRISGGELKWGMEKRGPGQLTLILFYPTQEGCKKQGGGGNQAESEVKWNRGVMLTPIFKPDGGLRSVSGFSLEAKQEKLLPIIHLF